MLKTSFKIGIAKLISKTLLLTGFKKINIYNRSEIKWKLNLSEGIDLSIFLFGSFQINVVEALINLINILNKKQGKYFNIIDVGSNIGDKSLLLSRKLIKLGIKNFKIFSIEPTSYAFQKQKINLNLNKILKKKISLYKYFISNNKKKPKMTYSSWELNSNQKKHKIHKGTLKKIDQTTKCLSLDQFINNNKINGEIIIKIDVDGFEMNVLESVKKYLKKKNPIILMEYADYALQENGYTKNKFLKFIKKYNYKIYDLGLKKIKNLKISKASSKDIILIKDII
tara:strand:- start:2641 stop:3489 length:849 start_codon:yes stop_codon:yes gene_type:complete